MPKLSVQGSLDKTLYLNNIFSRGMYHTIKELPEGCAKAIINFDITPTGGTARPRLPIIATKLNTKYIAEHTVPFHPTNQPDYLLYYEFPECISRDTYKHLGVGKTWLTSTEYTNLKPITVSKRNYTEPLISFDSSGCPTITTDNIPIVHSLGDVKFQIVSDSWVKIDHVDALGVLGVAVEKQEGMLPKVIYQGLLYFQYDGTNINLSTWQPYEPRISEKIGMGFNLLSDDPFTLRSYYNEEATERGYLAPEILGILPFANDKLISQIAIGALVYLRAYVALPPVISGYTHYAIKWDYREFNSDVWNEGKWEAVLTNMPYQTIWGGYTNNSVIRVTIAPANYVDKGGDRPELEPNLALTTVGIYPLLKVGNTTDFIKSLNTDIEIRSSSAMTYFNRQLILYDSHKNNNVIQFALFEELDYLPFPNYSITVPEPVKYVHPHNDRLVIFGQENIYMLYDGYEPTDLKFAKVASNMTTDMPSSVVSIGKDVFFISNKQGYLITPNRYSPLAKDVDVYCITDAINELLANPTSFIDNRLVYYNHPVAAVYNEKVLLEIRSHVYNQKLYLFCSYEDCDLMLVFIYDIKRRIWSMYDTMSGTLPSVIYNAEGMEIICRNDGYGTRNVFKDLGDYQDIQFTDNGVVKYDVQAGFMTGYPDIDNQNFKKFSKVLIEFINLSGMLLPASIDFQIDGKAVASTYVLGSALDEQGNEYMQYSSEPNAKLPSTTTVNQWSLNLSPFHANQRLRFEFGIGGKGRTAQFTFNVAIKGLFELVNYGIIYKKKSIK